MLDAPLVTPERLTELWGTWQPPDDLSDILASAGELESLSHYTAHFAAVTAILHDKQDRDLDRRNQR
jgi:hypothetical protein